MTKVSVLIPLYNTCEDHLREAIESILTQSFTNFELLLLNDSPDNLEIDRIVASYVDSRIKYFKNDQNLGITPSRNKLIELAQSEYLAIMDHDDVSLPERLRKQVDYLDKNVAVGVVSCNVKRLPAGNKSHWPEHDHDIKLALLSSCAIVHSASMIRKSVLLNIGIGYEEEFSPAEDYALWCRLIPHTKFYNFQEVLFLYRFHANNTAKLQKDKIDTATIAIRAFVKNDNPALYDEFLYRAVSKIKICLFSVIPILVIIKKHNKTKVYLFGIIPFLTFAKRIRY